MRKYFVMLGIIIGYSVYLIGNVSYPVEEIDVIVTEGFDINLKNYPYQYILPFSSHVYKSEGKKDSITTLTEGKSIEEAMEARTLKRDKKYINGLEKMYIISERFARIGIGDIMENKFNTTQVNDMAYIIIVNGESKDYVGLKINGYTSSGDYLSLLAKNMQLYNFFADDFKVIDALVRVKSEGRQIVIPYADLSKQGIEIKGVAIFNGDKMVKKIDIEEARALNLLRNDDVKGIISIEKNSKEYTDFSANVKKRKIRCNKKGDKYEFNINLSITGEVLSNNLYDGLMNNLSVKKEYEQDMSKHIEKMCNNFISKMQKEYKVDCLELGSYAAAKFGRRSNIDWNEVVSKSKINVKVKVTVDKQGRGEF